MTTTGEGAVLLTGERLAAASRACGAPILEHLQPGLVDEQIDALTAPLGLTAPAEARAWWGSHGGVPFPLPPRPGEVVGTGFVYLALARSVERTVQEREIAIGVARRNDPADLARGRFDSGVAIRALR